MSSSDAIGFGGLKPIPQIAPQPAATHTNEAAFIQIEKCEEACKGLSWRAKVRGWVDECKNKLEESKTFLDRIMPNTPQQKLLDDFGRKIEGFLSKAVPLNTWIHSNGMGAWYEQLCTSLLKLPLRIVADIIQMVYGVIKSAAYAFVHPLKMCVDLAKILIETLYCLTLPKSYVQMGAGTIGGSLGHAAISGGFGLHAYIGLGIGGGLLIFGTLWGAIESGITEREKHPAKAVLLVLWDYTKTVPVTMLVGFLVGTTLGAIQLQTIVNIPGQTLPETPHISFSVAQDPRS